jgi:hypothetical protein
MERIIKIRSIGLLFCLMMAAFAHETFAQNNRGDTVLSFKKSAQSDEEARKQKAERIKGQQQAVREQRRQAQLRRWQERSVGVPMQPRPIWGQTPLQQQQMALRDQKRLLQWQQKQSQRAQKVQKQNSKP